MTKRPSVTYSLDRITRGAIREDQSPVNIWIHPTTGSLVFRTYVREPNWRRDGKIEKRMKRLLVLPRGTSRRTVRWWCEELGAPPPWIHKAERPAWRADWRQRNGILDRRIERHRPKKVPMDFSNYADPKSVKK